MNRNQRKYVPKTKINGTTLKSKNNMQDDFEEVLPPRSKRHPFKAVANRCCYVSPICKDVELSTEDSGVYVDDHFNALIKQQYDCDPAINPDAIKNLQALQKVLCGASKVDNSSQYGTAEETYVKTCDGSKWQYVDDPRDIDKYIIIDKERQIPEKPNGENIRINEIPHIKVIAEKFEKYKKNNVELRKLKEKIVCLEYDVLGEHDDVPMQKLRAYFALKPTSNSDTPKALPSKIKHNFNITDDDLNKLNENEIEMIDSKLTANKSYLNDLQKLLRRKQEIKTKKRQNSLDVRTLYEMAKNDTLIIDKMSTGLLTKDEIKNIRDLIGRKSQTSVHGWSKRIVKRKLSDVSQSIIAQLMAE